MTQLTDEEIRDEVLSVFEEHEEQLISVTSQLEKIEKDGMMTFEKKILAAKNRLIQDPAIADDDLEKVYLEEVEKIRKEVLEKVEQQVQEVVAKNTQEQVA